MTSLGVTAFTVCERTGKRGYTSRRRAKRAMGKEAHSVRAYFCPLCHSWHTVQREYNRLEVRRRD